MCHTAAFAFESAIDGKAEIRVLQLQTAKQGCNRKALIAVVLMIDNLANCYRERDSSL